MNYYEYRMGNYERVAQRFITPIWQKDELGSISLSSTATKLTYRGIDYLILAAHALISKDQSRPLKGLGIISRDGKFLELANEVSSFKVFLDDDIVICQGKLFGNQLNFNLDIEEQTDELFWSQNKVYHNDKEVRCIAWVGFPANKAHSFHKSKTSIENLKTNEYDEINLINTKAKFRLIDLIGVCIEDDGLDMMEIPFPNKNIEFKLEGFKQQGPSLKGMSGGAVFYRPFALIDDINEKCSFEDLLQDLPAYFRFAGIGLEFSEKKEVIRACSKKRIIELLEQFEDIGKN